MCSLSADEEQFKASILEYASMLHTQKLKYLDVSKVIYDEQAESKRFEE